MTIGPFTELDRSEWEGLIRGFHAHWAGRPGRPATVVDDDGYERTWQRLLDGDQIRGIGAKLDGNMVGIAHYLFHASVWGAGRCYLAELFVDPKVRRRGIATAMIQWVAQDAEEHGAPRLYWNTEVDADARALYDKLAVYRGYILYNYSQPVPTDPRTDQPRGERADLDAGPSIQKRAAATGRVNGTISGATEPEA